MRKYSLDTITVIDRRVFPTPQSSLHLDFDGSACKRLITRAFIQSEVVSLIGEIFTSQDEVKMIGYLLGDDAQTFIDIMDEALDRTDLPPRLRRKCLSALCKICGRHALLPRSLKIPLCYDRQGTALYHGGYADVWKGEYRGLQVAVKVLRVYSTSDFEKITSRFCKEVVTWKILHHPNVLPLLGVTMDNNLSLFAMTSEWMKNGNIIEFIRAHQDANRFELLKDVAKGLIYMHSQAMIHGDLKGANILINQGGHACLADFGLLTVVSDPTNPTASSSSVKGGTTRWMSPELLDPDQYGIRDSRPTKESDAYALGMVILEVLSGRCPFSQFRDVVVMRMVLDGIRPERPNGPEGVWFTDDLWRLLASCWESQRERRPTIEAILEFLEHISGAWQPPAPQVDEDVEMGEDDWDLTTVSDSSGMIS
ncbi:kinase-like domain-containing protein [Thelephora terrestris]|uniref:Kinase-like domain-containing protein n=1 Tax=Thelephora terrestris TaxID=56493 RepID=A0A9P6HKP2_9AGAM|nr:kinase-like domain-containing protein [Thelephora terrestris]